MKHLYSILRPVQNVWLNLALTICLLGVSFTGRAQVTNTTSPFNPSDPLTKYNSAAPPAIPANGIISKWVYTPSITGWNDSTFKPYFYNGMAFRLQYPASYKPGVNDGKTYPLIIMFHGLGEAAPIYDNERQLFNGGQITQQALQNGTIDAFCIFPQNTGGVWGYSYYQNLQDLATYMEANCKVDPQRVVAHGLSAGGQAIWDIENSIPKWLAACIPMSAASNYYLNGDQGYKYTPIWLGQGGFDTAPTPANAQFVVNGITAIGGNISYTLFPFDGHDCWDSFYLLPGFWPFLINANKANPYVLYGKTAFCSASGIQDTIGLTPGFSSYRWYKNGVLIPGANSNYIVVNQTGSYTAQYQYDNGQWSYQSPIPAVISVTPPTTTPAITLARNESVVYPSPDTTGGGVALTVPGTFASYSWINVATNQVVGTNSVFVAKSPGQYEVTVAATGGCSGNYSAPFNVYPANGTGAPAPATNLTGSSPSVTSIQLSWVKNNAQTYNNTGFEVYRATQSGGPYTFVSLTGSNTTSYLDTALLSNKTYYYIVRAVNNNGASANTAELAVKVTADTQAPTAPGTLTVIPGTANTYLQWGKSTDNVAVSGYYIYINGVQTYTTNNLYYTVTGLTKGQSYYFTIKAFDPSGNISNPSNQVSATILDNGFNFEYINEPSQIGYLPNFLTSTPTGYGVTNNVYTDPVTYAQFQAILWQGTMHIPVTGNYTFQLASNAGSDLFIDQPYSPTATPTINNDGTHGTYFQPQATVYLTKGDHSIAVDYFTGNSGYIFNLYWLNTPTGVGSTPTNIPDSIFHTNIPPVGTLPTAPTGLVATGLAYNKIGLSWSNVNGSPQTGVQIFRSTSSSGPFTIVNTVSGSASSATDSLNLLPSTTYYYKIQSINSYGNSAFTSVSSAATKVTPPKVPNVPYGFTGTALSQTKIKLSWVDSIANITNYILYRSTDSINYTLLKTIPVGTTSTTTYTDSALTALTKYYYKVFAQNGTGNSNSSLVVKVITLSYPPPPFTAIAPQTMLAGTNLTLPLSAKDPNGAKVTFASLSIPSFATLTDNGNGTGSLALNPSLTNAGSYSLILSASDIYGTTKDTIKLTVNPLVQPTITAIAPLTLNPGDSITRTLSATDVNLNAVLAWSYNVLPSFVTAVTNANGTVTLTFKPKAMHAGIYNLFASVSDGVGGNANTNISITVNSTSYVSTYINFGDPSHIAPSPWNNTNTSTAPTGFSLSLKDQNGAISGSLITASTFSVSSSGVNSGNNSGIYPDLVSASTFTYSGTDTAKIQFTGLSPLNLYNFTILSSVSSPTGSGITKFILGTSLVSLNGTNNTINTANFTGIAPNSSGAITLKMVKDAAASNSTLNGLSFQSYPNPLTVPPTAPTSLSVKDTLAGVKLSWVNTATNATNYLVFRAPVTGTTVGTYVQINGSAAANPNLNSYLDTSARGSASYSYKVEATNTYGNSAFTTPLSITTADKPPVVPTIAAVTFGVATFDTVKVSASPRSGSTLSLTMTGLFGTAKFTDKGNGTGFLALNPALSDTGAHTLTLVATDAFTGTTSQSFKVTITNPYKVIPSAPTALAAKDSLPGTKLTWTNNTAYANNYLVYRAPVTGTTVGTYTQINTGVVANPNLNAYLDTSARGLSTYAYRVAATNLGGTSAYSNVVTLTTAEKPPVIPAIASVTYNITTNDTVKVSANVRTGTTVTLSMSGLFGTAKFVDKGNGTGYLALSPIASDTGAHILTFKATDANAGISTQNFTVTIKNPGAVPPTAPTSFSVKDTLPGVKLSWVNTATNATNYLVFRAPVTGTTVGTYVQINGSAAANPNLNSYLDTSARGSASYSYKVEATNTYGNSAFTTPLSITTADKPPVVPTIAAVTFGVATFDTVKVSASPRSGSTLSLTMTGLFGTAKFTDKGNGTGFLALNPALSDTGAHTLTLVATDAFTGTTSQSFKVTITNPYKVIPSAPTALAAKDSLPGTKLTWTNNTAYANNYLVYRAPVTGTTVGTYTQINTGVVANPNLNAYLDTSARGLSTYAYRVAATNLGGTSAYSNVVTLTTAEKPPVIPAIASVTYNITTNDTVKVSANVRTGTTVTLSMSGLFGTAKFVDKGNGTGYLALSPIASDTGAHILTFKATDASAGISTQNFTVTIKNPATIPPGAPNTLVAKDTLPGVKLSWVNTATTATNYLIFRAPVTGTTVGTYAQINASAIANPNLKTYLDTSARGSASYSYKVAATNGTVNSAFSNAALITTTDKPPIIASFPTAVSYNINTKDTLKFLVSVRSGTTVTLGMSGLFGSSKFVDNGNGTGYLAMAPISSDAGPHSLTLTATDFFSGTASQSFIVNIINPTPSYVSTYVNFGDNNHNTAPSPWNNTGYNVGTGTAFTLKDSTANALNNITMTLNSAFSAPSPGSTTGNNSGVYPDVVMTSSFAYSNTDSAKITFSGLNTSKLYNFTFFSSWANPWSGALTDFGIGNTTVALNGKNNTTNTVSINGVSPNSSGSITLRMTKDAANAAAAYLNALVIRSYSSIPPSPPTAPTSLAAKDSLPGVKLTWVNTATTASNYLVYRAPVTGTTVGTYVQINSASVANSNLTSYLDTSARGQSSYAYRVAATNSVGTSAYTNVVSLTTSEKPPILASIPAQSFTVSTFDTVKVSATPRSGSTLSLSMTGLFGTAKFVDKGNGTGYLALNPISTDLGVHTVTVTATDSYGGITSQSFAVTINSVVVPPSFVSTYVNFGDNSHTAPSPWNNTGYNVGTGTTFTLKDSTATPSNNITMTLNSAFNAPSSGSTTGNNSGIYPDVVMSSSFSYSNTDSAKITFSGLNTSKLYNFTIFSSWANPWSGAITNFGMGNTNLALDGKNNTTKTVSFIGLSPNSAGTITLRMTKDAANAASAYLNALVIRSYSSVPATPPTAPVLLVAKDSLPGVKLTWTNTATNASNYLVYRAPVTGTTIGTYVQINGAAAANANLNSYLDTSARGSSSYAYRVSATNAVGTSAYTNVVSLTTAEKPPVIATIASQSFTISTFDTIKVSVKVRSGTSVSLAMTGLFGNAKFVDKGNGTGYLALNPVTTDIGVHTLSLTATDAFAGTATQSFAVTINNVVVAPTYVSTYVNFGDNGHIAPSPWNNTGYNVGSGTIFTLKDSTATPSNNITMTLNSAFSAPSSGSTTGNNTGIYPDLVMSSSFAYSNTDSAKITFSGLNTSKLYNFTLFSSWANPWSGAITDFGIGNTTLALDGKNNTTKTVSFIGLSPNAAGAITLRMTKDAANAASAYINGLVIRSYTAVPATAPTAPVLLATKDSLPGVKLTWTNTATNATNYLVYRAPVTGTTVGTYVQINAAAPANANLTSYLDTSARGSASYSYKVAAYNSLGTAFSSPVGLTTAEKPPVLATLNAQTFTVLTYDTVKVSANIRSGSTVSLTMTGLFGTAKFVDKGNGTGYLALNPALTDIGVHTITLTATDAFSGTSSQSFTVTINNVVITPSYVSTYVNFGDNGHIAPSPWNNTGYNVGSGTVFTLKDSTANALNNITMTLNSAFSAPSSGATTGNNTGVFPDLVMSSSFAYSNTDSAKITFSGLNTKNLYNFTILSSWANPWSGAITDFGIGNTTLALNGKNNTTNTVSFNGLAPNSSGSITLRMTKDAANASSAYINGLVIRGYANPATNPPTAPILLVAKDSIPGVYLTWVNQATNSTNYLVYRAPVTAGVIGTYAQINTKSTANPNLNSYLDTSARIQSAYAYKVAATNANGNSAYTNVVQITHSDFPPIIATIANVTYSIPSKDTVKVSASPRSGTTVALSMTGLFGTAKFTDKGNGSGYLALNPVLADTGIHTLTLVATDAFAGTSSKTFTVTILNPNKVAPSAPTTLAAKDSLPGVKLTWVNTSAYATNYLVYRAPVTGTTVGTYAQINAGAVANPNLNTYLDTSARGLSTYAYRVAATNSAGTSAFSNVVSLTTAEKPALISPISPVTYAVSSFDTVKVSASLRSGTALTLTMTGLFGTAKFTDKGNGTGYLALNPAIADTGVHTLILSAFDGTATSTQSFTVTITNPFKVIPTAPSTLAAKDSLPGVYLSWVNTSAYASNYLVYRAPVTAGLIGTYAQINTKAIANGNLNAYLDTSARTLSGYAYKVAATNAGGTSAFSNVAQITHADFPPLVPAIASVTYSIPSKDTVKVSASPRSGTTVALSMTGLFGTAKFTDKGNGSGYLALNPVLADTGIHTLTLVATDAFAGTSSKTFTVTILNPNKVAPSAPTTLAAKDSLPGVKLTWVNTSAYATNYLVYRAPVTGTTVGTYAQINAGAVANPNLNTYLDTSARGLSTYAYRVAATNSAGTSAFSNVVSLTTAEKPALISPISPVTYAVSSFDTVKVSASLRSGTALTLTMTGLFGTAKFTDKGNGTGYLALNPAIADTGVHTLTLSAFDGTATSTQSFTVTILNPNKVAPNAPTNLVAKDSLPGIKLTWINNSIYATNYLVYRAPVTGTTIGTYSQINVLSPANPNLNTYLDTSARFTSTYAYKVAATNAGGTSAFTSVVQMIHADVPPILPTVPSVSYSINTNDTVRVSASPVSGNKVSLSMTGLFGSAQFIDNGNGTGYLALKPVISDTGIHTLSLVATDAYAGTISQSFDVTIKTINGAPYISTYVNFGDMTHLAPYPWNNTNSSTAVSGTAYSLKDQTGSISGTMTLGNTFAIANSGVNTGNNSGVYPDLVSTSAFTYTGSDTAKITFSGLNPLKYYNFNILSSLANPSGSGITNFKIGSTQVSLNGTINSNQTAGISKVAPNASGIITLNIIKDPSATFASINGLVYQSYYQLPAAPTLLKGHGNTTSTIGLSWVIAPNSSKYYIYRATQATGPYSLIDSVSGTTTNYVNTGLPSNTGYFYQLRTVNSIGVLSLPGNIAFASTLNYVVQVQFNINTPAGTGWNSFNTLPSVGLALNNLVSTSNINSGITVTLAKKFDGANEAGNVTGNNSGVYPDAVLDGQYYVQTPDSTLVQLSNLPAGSSFDLILFNSVVPQFPSTNTTFTINNGPSQNLNGTSNTNQTIQFNNILPDGNGNINVGIKAGPGGEYGVINAMVIQVHPIQSNAPNVTIAGLKKDELAFAPAFSDPQTPDADVFPVPFNQTLNVRLNSPGTGSYKVIIYDLKGSLVYDEPMQILEKGISTRTLNNNVANLSSGIYILKIVSDNMPTKTIKIRKY